ncbi:RraA family protein [Dongia sp.]|uniref:RraA family protein n=1 Tax=Dongia sp. TaxID=1977262 RepID=UPI00375012B1
MSVIIHPVTRDLTEADIAPWRAIPVAVAVDLSPESQIDPAIRPINPPGKQPKLFGLAVTTSCTPPDFGAVVHALEHVGKGEVLVIAAGGDAVTAMIGEILSGHLRNRGAAGVVCDGPVRDVATLAGWTDFSVFSRSITPRGPTSAAGGMLNAPVTIGGRRVTPGDLIIGDDDGLVALSPATVRNRIRDAEARLAREDGWIKSLAAGKNVVETFGVEPA